MKKVSRILAMFSLALAALSAAACGIYSFSGTSIQSDVKTITIDYVEYKALRVNPNLAGNLTDALKEKYRKMTKLEQVDMDGDMEVACEITGYDTRATAVTADEVAAKNRLTVTVKCNFTNRKHPDEDFSKSFSAYADYDSTNSLDAVENTLCEDIVDQLVEDILNATVANW